MIVFDRVSFKYDPDSETPPILDEVSFSFSRGETVALLGGNGCGKSTLTLLAAGVLLPYSGKVTVSGIDTVTRNPEVQKKVAVIFQNPERQIVGTTIEEDLAFGLENQGIPSSEIRQRIDLAAETFDLNDLLHTPTWLLSGGMQQKLALASAMIIRPEYLILDEPTSHLDPWSAADLWENIFSLQRDLNLGILVVSQRPEDYENLERAIVLASGKVTFDGHMKKLWDDADFDRWKIALPEGIRFNMLSMNGIRDTSVVDHEHEMQRSVK